MSKGPKKKPGSAKSKKNGEGVRSDSGDKGVAIPMISAGALSTLIKQVTKFQNDVSTASGNIGDLVRDYADNKNLHKGAFADIKKLYRMGKKDAGKLWLFLAHFDDMRKKLDLDGMAKSQGQLLAAGTEEDEDGEQLGPDDREAGPGRDTNEVAGAPVH